MSIANLCTSHRTVRWSGTVKVEIGAFFVWYRPLNLLLSLPSGLNGSYKVAEILWCVSSLFFACRVLPTFPCC